MNIELYQLFLFFLLSSLFKVLEVQGFSWRYFVTIYKFKPSISYTTMSLYNLMWRSFYWNDHGEKTTLTVDRKWEANSFLPCCISLTQPLLIPIILWMIISTSAKICCFWSFAETIGTVWATTVLWLLLSVWLIWRVLWRLTRFKWRNIPSFLVVCCRCNCIFDNTDGGCGG